MVNKFLTVRTEVLRNCSEGSHSIDDFALSHVSEKLKLSFFVKGGNFFSKLGKIGNTDMTCSGVSQTFF